MWFLFSSSFHIFISMSLSHLVTSGSVKKSSPGFVDLLLLPPPRTATLPHSYCRFVKDPFSGVPAERKGRSSLRTKRDPRVLSWTAGGVQQWSALSNLHTGHFACSRLVKALEVRVKERSAELCAQGQRVRTHGEVTPHLARPGSLVGYGRQTHCGKDIKLIE